MNNIKNPIKRNKRVYLLNSTIDKFANLYIPIDRGHIVDVFKYERDLVRRIDERRQILLVEHGSACESVRKYFSLAENL